MKKFFLFDNTESDTRVSNTRLLSHAAGLVGQNMAYSLVSSRLFVFLNTVLLPGIPAPSLSPSCHQPSGTVKAGGLVTVLFFCARAQCLACGCSVLATSKQDECCPSAKPLLCPQLRIPHEHLLAGHYPLPAWDHGYLCPLFYCS